MVPEEIRSTVRRLQQAIAAIDRDWAIAVCSPDARFQATVALLLERCTHTADSIAELLALPLPSPPAPLLVLCDDDMPDGGAEELIAQLRTNRSAEQCRVLVCLAPEISATRLEALWRGGADGLCCYRNAGSGQLLKTVWSLLQGNACIDPELSAQLRQPAALCSITPTGRSLSHRDRDLIRAIARGHSSRQIAALMQLRCDTVRRRLSDLYRRLGVRDHRGLIAWGLQQGVIRNLDLATS